MELLKQINSLNKNPQSKEEQIRFLSDLINSEKADDRILEWAGFLALENEQWLMAEEIFSSLLERRKKALDLVGLAKALCRQSRLDEAEECYLSARDRITEPCSLLFVIHKCLGDIYLLKNNFSMAEEYYNKASAFNPHCKGLMFKRAVMYLKEKNYVSAEQSFQNFIQSSPHSAKAWLGLAVTRKALGDDNLALACLNRSLDFDSKNQKALALKKKWQPSLFKESSCNLNFSI